MLTKEELAEFGLTRQDGLDVEQVMSTEAGRRFVHRVLVKTGLYRVSYDPDQPPERTFFNEGARNVGLNLTAETQAIVPGSFIKMIGENQDVE